MLAVPSPHSTRAASIVIIERSCRFRQPPPGVWSPLWSEELAVANRVHGHECLGTGELLLECVGELPVAFDHVEDGQVRRTTNGNRAQLIAQSNAARGVDGSHSHHISQAVANRHELRHAVQQANAELAAARGQITARGIWPETQLSLAPRHLDAEIAAPQR